MADNEQIAKLIHKLSERMGTPESELKSALEGSNYSKLLSRMPAEQAGQLEHILNDEQAARQFLNSPQAKAIIKRIMG